MIYGHGSKRQLTWGKSHICSQPENMEVDKGPYYKNKLEMKSNWSEILPRLIASCVILFQLKLTKLKLEVLNSDFQRKK